MKRILYIAIACCIIQVSCVKKEISPIASMEKITDKKNVMDGLQPIDSTVKKIISDYKQSYAELQTMDAKVRMHIGYTGSSQLVSMVIRAKKNTEIQVTILTFFGVVMDALIKKDSVVGYNALQNKLYVGRNTTTNIEKMGMVSVAFEDLNDLVFSIPTFSDSLKYYSMSKNKGAFVYRKDSIASTRYAYDVATNMITSIHATSRDGVGNSRQVSWNFSQFTETQVGNKSIKIPERMELQIENTKEGVSNKFSISIVVENRYYNRPDFKTMFTSPVGVKVVSLDAM